MGEARGGGVWGEGSEGVVVVGMDGWRDSGGRGWDFAGLDWGIGIDIGTGGVGGRGGTPYPNECNFKGY